MRRATAAVCGTLGGTALLLAAKFGMSGTGGTAAAGNQNAGQTGDAGPAEPQDTSPGKHKLKSGVFRGTRSVNEYTPVQVTITVAKGRITRVTATHNTTPARTLQINKRAIPKLRQEALAAQSAKIDTVSGATETSGSFKTSLRAALAAAKA